MFNISLINAVPTVEINADIAFLWILLSGILVLYIQSEFTMVESGFTHSKNAVNISMKNILNISVGTFPYWFIGLRVSEEIEEKGLDQSKYGIKGFEASIKDNTK